MHGSNDVMRSGRLSSKCDALRQYLTDFLLLIIQRAEGLRCGGNSICTGAGKVRK